ncbi:MAG TPA: hypothetical protein VGD80_11010 [Kofleriaceae bacterium]
MLRLALCLLGLALRLLGLALRLARCLPGLALRFARGFLSIVVVVVVVVVVAVRIVVAVARRREAGRADEQPAAKHECDQGGMPHENLRPHGAMARAGG